MLKSLMEKVDNIPVQISTFSWEMEIKGEKMLELKYSSICEAGLQSRGFLGSRASRDWLIMCGLALEQISTPLCLGEIFAQIHLWTLDLTFRRLLPERATQYSSFPPLLACNALASGNAHSSPNISAIWGLQVFALAVSTSSDVMTVLLS